MPDYTEQIDALLAQVASLDQQLSGPHRKVSQRYAAIGARSDMSPGEEKREREKADWEYIKASQGSRAELLRVLDELSSLYLKANEEQRAHVRRVVAERHEVLEVLNNYVYRAIEKLRDTRSAEWLQRGLASVALEDLHVDYRDTLIALGELYLAALEAGMDPLPHFKEVAALSSADTQKFLGSFDRSAYFLGPVTRKIRTLQSSDT